MRIDRWLLVFCLAVFLPGAAAAQVRVSAETEVRSIGLRGVQSLPQQELNALLQTRARGALFGLRNVVGKLPLIPGPARHRFHPRVLQEDVVRLRERYRAAGFPEVDISYEVEAAGDGRLLDIVFVVDEGPAQLVSGVSITAQDGVSPPPVPPDQAAGWSRAEAGANRLAGRQLDVYAIRQQRDLLQAWWRDRGYPAATVSGSVERDSLDGDGRVRFVVDAGSREFFGPISVQGNRSISDHVVRRALPFRPGDRYSARALHEGRTDLQQLQIVRASRLAIDRPDSVGPGVPVLVTVTEAKPRLITGQIGYLTDAGLSAETRWSHRNFAGAARVFTVSGLAETGLLTPADDRQERYRGTISLQQPYLFHRRLSGVVTPFVEYRDDVQDRSLQFGSNFTLIYRRHRLLSGSLDYQAARRNIYEYRLGELAAGRVDLLTYLTDLADDQADSLGTRLTSSLFTLSALAGTLDDPANPHRGVLVRPALQVTAPTGAASASYWRADCTAYAFAPLGDRVTLAGRVAAGRLFPFGKSLPDPGQSPTTSFLRLRDAAFTAGGGADVRGWGHRLLGPKFPDVRFTQLGDSVGIHSDGYVPLGGHSRTSFTLELRLPLPGMGRGFGSHVFLDGGRVWTDDSRFDVDEDRFDQERYFYATGAGIDILTPVGSIRLSLGYKLNPSLPDLVDSDELLRALLAEEPVEELPQHNSRRWQLNLAIGASY